MNYEIGTNKESSAKQCKWSIKLIVSKYYNIKRRKNHFFFEIKICNWELNTAKTWPKNFNISSAFFLDSMTKAIQCGHSFSKKLSFIFLNYVGVSNTQYSQTGKLINFNKVKWKFLVQPHLVFLKIISSFQFLGVLRHRLLPPMLIFLFLFWFIIIFLSQAYAFF